MNQGTRKSKSTPTPANPNRVTSLSVPTPIPAPTATAPSLPIRIAAIDDSPELRLGLAALFQDVSGIQWVGSYAGVTSALQGLASAPADIVLLDLQMPEIDGATGIPKLRAAFPDIQFLVFTMFQGDDDIFRALSNGAAGYLLKSDPPARILASIHETRNGGAPMSPSVARRVLQTFQKPAPTKEAPTLTAKETAILNLLRSGVGYKGTAAELNITIDTVRDYVRKIYQKLQVHSLVGALSKIDS